MEQGVKAIRKYALNAFECVRMRLNTHRDAVLGQLLAHLRLEPTDHIDFSAIHCELPDHGLGRCLLSFEEAHRFLDNLGVDHGGLETEGPRHADGVILNEKR